MLFNSVEFLVFFPVVVITMFALPTKLRNLFLLCRSLYFYMSWEPRYIVLIGFSILVTYICALLIDKFHKEENIKLKKISLTVAIFLNLAVLFVFKYYDFFVYNVNTVFGAALPFIKVALPVGISFFTFQVMGYVIDVYEGKLPAEKNLVNYALFISFFPQLVAGPIERATNLLPQFYKKHKFDYARVKDGLVLMAWGFFKKLVVADSVAAIVNTVYNDVTRYTGMQLIIATVLFAFQIYGDFSGYSDIARGAAKVLGYNLMANFNRPYISKSFTEFWSRWHISLSGWFQDYIFQPIVWHSKNPAFAAYYAILTVFIVSGFWHGAAWTYVVWGLLHALFRMLEIYTRKAKKKFYKKLGVNTKGKIYGGFKIITTFALVCFTYIFFRANNLADAMYIVCNMFSDIGSVFVGGHIVSCLEGMSFYSNNGMALVLCILFMLFMEKWAGNEAVFERIGRCKAPVRWLFYYAIMMLILFFGWFGQSQFIYFQF